MHSKYNPETRFRLLSLAPRNCPTDRIFALIKLLGVYEMKRNGLSQVLINEVGGDEIPRNSL